MMFKKSRLNAAFIRRLTAAAVIPLSVLAMGLLVRPAEKDAAALYISEPEEETAVNIFLVGSDNEFIGQTDGTGYLLPANQKITVRYQGEEMTEVSKRESVVDFLSRLDLQLSPLEMVAVYSPQTSPEIVIDSELVFYERESSVAEYETVYRYNSEKPEGYEEVVQQGQNGVRQEVYEIIYQDGVEVARQLIDQVESETVDEIVEKGTGVFAVPNELAASVSSNGDGTGTITLENGTVVTFSSVRTMRGTAYTKDEGRVGSRTASGTAVRRGVVAVDRNVLPLGTKVYVVSNDGKYDYGMAVAEDTGVRGNTIDLYMDSLSECIRFGVRDCTVYILD